MCSLPRHLRALHTAVPLGLNSTGLPLWALRLPLLTAGYLAKSRQAAESSATLAFSSDGAAPQNGFPWRVTRPAVFGNPEDGRHIWSSVRLRQAVKSEFS